MVVLHPLALGELEQKAVQREAGLARRLQREPNAGGRIVDGVGQEVDGEQSALVRQAQASRQAYGLDSASLVERLAVAGVDRLKDAGGALAGWASDQRLVAEHRAGSHVHHGLERHGEGRLEDVAVAACLTPFSAHQTHFPNTCIPFVILEGLTKR